MEPSSEAVEAAAEAIQSRWRMSHSAAVRNDAHAALAAALPIIRREIAEAIDAERLFDNTGDPADDAYQTAILLAVEIARGEVSR
jgi:predicted DNA-binding transcriptional regulator YafY